MDESMTFENALAKLETIVKNLESGDLSLENSLTAYQEGMELARFCHDQIKNAEAVIVKLMTEDTLEDFKPKEE
ncbi:MAG: exodeoxyribonuclease VII small subunit [Candidatus Izemoplasmatales bacterium]|nr:exodeoxyribonuclease VII small subunit [Candidatus Izemoplasmatales bacterium]